MTAKTRLKKGSSDKPLSERRSLRGSTAKRQQESALPMIKAGSENFARADLGAAGIAAAQALTPRQRFRNEIDQQTAKINIERAAKGQPPLALFSDSSRANGTDDQKLDAFIDRLDDRADSGNDPFLYVGSGEVIDDGVRLAAMRMHAVLPKTLPVDEWERASIAVHDAQKFLLLPGQTPTVAPTPAAPGVPLTPEEQRRADLARVEMHRPIVSRTIRRGM